MAIQVEEISADYTGMIVEADYQEYIRYDGTDQATIMPTLVESAIRQAEAYCNATFGDKQYIYQRSEFEPNCAYYLPYAPIRTVDSVKVQNQDGSYTSLTEGTDYVVRGITRKYIILTYNVQITGSIPQILEIEYKAGNATPANVNLQVKEAILQIMSENFENRMEGVVGESVAMLPRTSCVKLAPFRNNVY